MRTTTKVIVHDLTSSWTPAVFFLFQIVLFEDAYAEYFGLWALGPAVAVAVVVGFGHYRSERGALVPAWLASTRRQLLAIAIVGAVSVASLAVWPTASVSGLLIVVFGQAVGMAGYRLVYGIVKPVPEHRLASFEEPAN